MKKYIKISRYTIHYVEQETVTDEYLLVQEPLLEIIKNFKTSQFKFIVNETLNYKLNTYQYDQYEEYEKRNKVNKKINLYFKNIASYKNIIEQKGIFTDDELSSYIDRIKVK